MIHEVFIWMSTSSLKIWVNLIYLLLEVKWRKTFNGNKQKMSSSRNNNTFFRILFFQFGNSQKMQISVFSSLGAIRNKVTKNILYKPFCGSMFWFLLGKKLEVE